MKNRRENLGNVEGPALHPAGMEAAPANGAAFLFLGIPSIVTTATQSDADFVSSLQAKNSNALGFLTRRAIDAYIADDAVTVILNEVEPVGYLISRRIQRWPRSTTLRRVTQIVVAAEHRCKGFGYGLLSSLISIARSDRTPALEARCRDELMANDFWRRNGFKLIDRDLRQNARRQAINIWRLPLTKQIPSWVAFSNQTRER